MGEIWSILAFLAVDLAKMETPQQALAYNRLIGLVVPNLSFETICKIFLALKDFFS
jgi:hypothetical protein